MKLEKLLRGWGEKGRKEVREQLRQGLVSVNGELEFEAAALIGPFDSVWCDGQCVQSRKRRAVMLHKPLGVVSATRDEEHETVVDLLQEDWAEELHLAGRLDRFTSGLMILTNESALSERLTLPGEKLGKRYRVKCAQAFSHEVIEACRAGLWFEKEQIQTQPAQFESIASDECLLTIYEGKHHQVKRMFARFGIKVLALHREAMGPLELDPLLAPGQWRLLTEEERVLIERTPQVWAKG